MDDSIRANGSTIICMDPESTHGRMVESMKVTIRTIRSTDLEFTHGLTAVNTKGTGVVESNTV